MKGEGVEKELRAFFEIFLDKRIPLSILMKISGNFDVGGVAAFFFSSWFLPLGR